MLRNRYPWINFASGLFVLLALPAEIAISAAPIHAQTRSDASHYGRRNTLGAFGAYSPTSGHVLLGDVTDRELLNIGVSYERQLFINRVVKGQYSAEFAPVALESDPVQIVHVTIDTTIPEGTSDRTVTEPTFRNCEPFSETLTVFGSGTETVVATCGRRWTMGEALSPVGFRLSFHPERRIQPFVDGHGGYMYSTQPIPITGAASFNFTFDFGGGVELYRSKSRSMRIEYRFHHISNHNTAAVNPGIDNGLIQFTYCIGFGR